MIIVNRYELPWDECISIKLFLEVLKKDRRFELIINETSLVIRNNEVLNPNSFSKEIIKNGDALRIIPRIFGG